LGTHGEVRWVQVRGFPVRNSEGKIFRLVGTAQEITDQKRAEDQVIQNLRSAEASRAEAEALRTATLALTQDLRMDFVVIRAKKCLAARYMSCRCGAIRQIGCS